MIISLLTHSGLANQLSSPYLALELLEFREDSLDKLYWQIDGIWHIKWFNAAPSPWDNMTQRVFPFSTHILNSPYSPSPIPPLPQTDLFDIKTYYAPFPFSRLKLFLGLPASEGISFTHIQPIIKKWTIDATFKAYNSDGWLINHSQKRHSIALGTHIPLDSTRYIYIKGNISKDRFGTNNGLVTYIPNLPSRIQPVKDNFSYSAIEEKFLYVSVDNRRRFRYYPPSKDSPGRFFFVPAFRYQQQKFAHFSTDTFSLTKTYLEFGATLFYEYEKTKIAKKHKEHKQKTVYLTSDIEPTILVFRYPKLDSSWFYGSGLQAYIYTSFFKQVYLSLSSNINYLSSLSNKNYLTYYLKVRATLGSVLYNSVELTFTTSRQFSPWFWQNPLMEEHRASLHFEFRRSNFRINLYNFLQFFPLYEVYDTSQTLIYAGKLMTVKHDINVDIMFKKDFELKPLLKISLGGSIYSYQSPAIMPVYDAFVNVQLRPGKKRNFHMSLIVRAMDNVPALFYAPLHYWAYVPVSPGFNATADFEIGWRFKKALIKGKINNIPAFINPELYRPVKNWLWAPLVHFSLMWDMFY